MIPKVVKENKAEAAIEYINYNSLDPDTVDEVDKALFVIKETRVGGEYFKAGEVSKLVYDKLKNSKGTNWKFSASYHHTKCANCKIRTMSSTDSGACRPLIPEQIVHYFGQPRMGGRHQMGS
ncbi:MAG: hypothetical protein HOM18_09250 [Candidatus Marinimicrobia bacterium]|nr:hypothetical protein [Candidatus Neomarinimicrobiota bacterium]